MVDFVICLVQEPFDFHLFAAHTMCLVPVHFGASYRPAGKANLRNTLELAPASVAESAAQPHDITDPPPNSYCFNILYLPDEFKIHNGYYPSGGC